MEIRGSQAERVHKNMDAKTENAEEKNGPERVENKETNGKSKDTVGSKSKLRGNEGVVRGNLLGPYGKGTSYTNIPLNNASTPASSSNDIPYINSYLENVSSGLNSLDDLNLLPNGGVRLLPLSGEPIGSIPLLSLPSIGLSPPTSPLSDDINNVSDINFSSPLNVGLSSSQVMPTTPNNGNGIPHNDANGINLQLPLNADLLSPPVIPATPSNGNNTPRSIAENLLHESQESVRSPLIRIPTNYEDMMEFGDLTPNSHLEDDDKPFTNYIDANGKLCSRFPIEYEHISPKPMWEGTVTNNSGKELKYLSLLVSVKDEKFSWRQNIKNNPLAISQGSMIHPNTQMGVIVGLLVTSTRLNYLTEDFKRATLLNFKKFRDCRLPDSIVTDGVNKWWSRNMVTAKLKFEGVTDSNIIKWWKSKEDDNVNWDD
jgi:hypothetical protein